MKRSTISFCLYLCLLSAVLLLVGSQLSEAKGKKTTKRTTTKPTTEESTVESTTEEAAPDSTTEEANESTTEETTEEPEPTTTKASCIKSGGRCNMFDFKGPKCCGFVCFLGLCM